MCLSAWNCRKIIQTDKDLGLDAAILLHSRLARNNAGGNHYRYDPLSSGDLNLPHEAGQTAAHARQEYASVFGHGGRLRRLAQGAAQFILLCKT
jgi:hypothetical protein